MRPTRSSGATSWRQQYWKEARATLSLATSDAISRSLSPPSDITAELWQAASDLLDAALPPAVLARGIRLIGLAVTGLGEPPPVQQQLFTDDPATQRQRHRELDHVTDAIQARFGGKAITSAAGLTKPVGEG
jgi:hypothetical protein